MNALSVATLAELDAGAGMPHGGMTPFIFHAREPRESSALYCELHANVAAKFFANGAGEQEGAIEPKENYPADSAETVFGRIPMFAAATLSRFAFFTKYMASSAKCSKPSLVRESAG